MNPSKADILVIDDTPENLTLLANILTARGYKVRSANKASNGLRAAQAVKPDLILLDIFMPEMNGYELCEHLKADEKTQDIPIIFISALGEAMDKVKAFSVGGIDYITKPFQVEEVIARVENHLKLQAAKLEISMLNENLEKRVKDRTQELEVMQEELRYLALHDPLTHLPNRTFFFQQLEKAIAASQSDPAYQFALLFLDGDRFKNINDYLGHNAGDQLLVEVARRLEIALPTNSIFARLGGDEFTILVDQIEDLTTATAIADLVHQTMKAAFQLGNNPVSISFSIGICLGNTYQQAEAVLRDADTAMYRAKALGSGYSQVFDQEMQVQVRNRLEIENDLYQAIEENSLDVYYQPIIDLKTQEIKSFEALVRWHHPTKGLISPLDFIAIAENTGLIIPLGLQVLEKACAQLKQWQNAQLITADTSISVNLSPKQFSQIDLLEKILQIVADQQLARKCLKLEITESAIIDNLDNAQKILTQLQAQEIAISIDDFGTGYSSLSYLHQFPINTLKLDRSFIIDIDCNQQKKEIVRTIINLAQALNMNTIAEGIETASQRSVLRELNCELMQGYWFSRPLPEAQMSEFLAAL
ncbi:MAG: two-component system response regulator [Microcystaceae cyanobacterium]